MREGLELAGELVVGVVVFAVLDVVAAEDGDFVVAGVGFPLWASVSEPAKERVNGQRSEE